MEKKTLVIILALSISFRKFLKYAELTESYRVKVEETKVTVTFTPSNPDAISHFDDKENITIILEGEIDGENLVFQKMTIFEYNKPIEVDNEYMERFLGPWLEAIEHSVN